MRGGGGGKKRRVVVALGRLGMSDDVLTQERTWDSARAQEESKKKSAAPGYTA